ncbi:MAG: hypothetical protein M3R25_02990 [Bacteroidota bacterium]|nr:hypothetical protein [Bacteroidota bacterium]
MPANGSSRLKTHFITILLAQAVIYTIVWIWDEYVASYMTLIFPGVLTVILILAVIADIIEPSRISRWYYLIMLGSILVPILIGATFYYMHDGNLEWLSN